MVGCVIVTYNPEVEIKKTIDLLLNQVDKIIIVDNKSRSESLETFKSILDDNDKIEIIFNEENLGIATALNIGIRHLQKYNYNWILTMDQDSKASFNMVKKMLQVYNGINEDERNKILSIFPNFVDESVQTVDGNSFENEYIYVDAEITSGNLINIEAFDKIGYFDETLFIDMVDTDFCMRLYEKGIKMIKVRDAILLHSLGDGKSIKCIFGTFNTSNHSALRRYYMTRNRFYIWKKYKEIDSFTLKRDKKLFLKECVKIALGEENKIQKFKMSLKGFYHYKKGIRGKL